MAVGAEKYESSKYKYVVKEINGDSVEWKINVRGFAQKRYNLERDAAISVDKAMIAKGKEPVNILVRKK